jgi:hypothetical protein
MIRTVFAALLVVALAACPLRLGPGATQTFRTLAISSAVEEPAEAAARIRALQTDIAILATPADSAWFAAVASAANLELSGPSAANARSFAFLGPQVVGDTAVRLAVEGGGELAAHDALYQIDARRHLNVMAVAIPAGVELRAAIRALTGYIATDVMPRAAVVLAVLPPDQAAGEALASLLQPLFVDAAACVRQTAGEETAPAPALRLFYGPPALVRCESGRFLEGPTAPVFARLVVLP